jgi:hypothetical protein
VWSAEERAEGLEYMHPKPSSHSGRIVGHPEAGHERANRKQTHYQAQSGKQAVEFARLLEENELIFQAANDLRK